MQSVSKQPNHIRLYWDGLFKGVFRASKCGRCEKHIFPPTSCCEHCGSWDVAGVELSGRDTLLFATHTGPAASHPRFEKTWPPV